MTEIKWEDTTSYRRGERYHAEPQSWEAQVGVIRIAVVRYPEQPAWSMRCDGCDVEEFDIGTDADAAKEDALEILREWLQDHCALIGGDATKAPPG